VSHALQRKAAVTDAEYFFEVSGIPLELPSILAGPLRKVLGNLLRGVQRRTSPAAGQ